MGDIAIGKHRTWYKACPELPFSFCANLTITILFVILLPVLLIFVPLAITIYHTAYFEPIKKIRQQRPCSTSRKVLIWILYILIVTPLAIVVCLVGSVLAGAILILPGYFYSIGLLVRMSIAGCHTKL